MGDFDKWWVERFGRPPMLEDNELFDACLEAFRVGRGKGEGLKIEEKKEQLHEGAEGVILFDGYEDALIGFCLRFGREPVAIYDMDQCIESLMDEGVDFEQASEHFYTNTLGTWAGDGTPAFLKRFR